MSGSAMIRLAWAEVRQHPIRYAATLAATALGVGFVVALLVFVPTQFRAIGQRATAQTSVADVVITGAGDHDGAIEQRIAAVPGVALVEPRFHGVAQFSSGVRSGAIELSSLPSDPRFGWLDLIDGRWPASADELVVSRGTAEAYQLGIGQSITLSWSGASTVRIVGITDAGRSLFADTEATGAASARLFTGERASDPMLLVAAAPGTDPGQLRDAIRAVVPTDATVQTSEEVAQQTLDQLSGGVQAGYLLLLVFGPIALLVGGMVVTNTQLLVLTQRRRQLALLRLVGAGRGQVRRGLLLETLLVGLVGSLVGVGLGLGAAVGMSAASDNLLGGLVVPAGQLVLAVVVGLLVGVGASLLPTWRATRVAPVEALRPVPDATERRNVGRVRLALGLLAMGLGGSAVALALNVRQGFPLAVGGCAVLAVGILVLAPTYIPPLLGALGRVVGRAGPTARLAVTNVADHPRRTAATAAALMVAVGLIVTLQVGAASVKMSVEGEVARQFPVDVTVQSANEAVSPAVRTAVAAIPAVEAVEPVALADAAVLVAGRRDAATVVGLGPDAARVVGGGIEALRPGVALAHPSTLESLDVSAGHAVRLQVGGHGVTVRLEKSDIPDAGQLVVQQALLDRLAPGAPQRGLWVKTDHAHPAGTVAEINQATSTQVGLTVGGSLVQSAEVGSTVDAVLLVATVLLAVAVLIAVIGVGNTIGLSVIERARESALLRALGLQRRQLRAMLAVEAGLLAVAATVVGIAVGIGFGVIGTFSLAHQIGVAEVRLAVSGPQTLMVIGVALAAGLLASVLPGRRAASADPATVLADD